MKALKWLLYGIGVWIFLGIIFWGGYLYGINADKDIHHKSYPHHWGYGGEQSFLTMPNTDNSPTSLIVGDLYYFRFSAYNFSDSSSSNITGYLSKPTWLPEWIYDLINNNHDIFINYSTANNSAGWDYGD